MVFLVSGGLSEGARPFPLKIFDTKISVNSTSGECIKLIKDTLQCLHAFIAAYGFQLFVSVESTEEPARMHFVIGHQNGFGWTKDGLVFPSLPALVVTGVDW